MAEVLITLGIIGIVAAMTLPAIIHKKTSMELETAFKKAYSNLYNAFNLVITEDYPVYFANPTDVDYNSVFAQEVYKKYRKLTKISNSEKNEYKKSSKNFLKKVTANYPGCSQFMNSDNAFITSDGSAMSMLQNCGALWITIDTNGIKKGPNAMGHDIFIFRIPKNTTKLMPANYEVLGHYDDEGNLTGTTTQYDKDACSRENNTDINGTTCGVFAVKNECPWDKTKTYWECLP